MVMCSVIDRIVMSDDFTIVSYEYLREISDGLYVYCLAVLPLPIIFSFFVIALSGL